MTSSRLARLGLPASLLLLLGSLGAGGWWLTQSLVHTQTLNESRTVADLAESVGRWASQYGGVHVRTQGGDTRIPGSFLTRSVYATTEGDSELLRGAATSAEAERQALGRTEAYHWKNPALIQREVADAVSAAGLRARYRLTARTVLNPDNAATPFELAALDQLQGGKAGSEVWRVEGGRMFYARAVVAQKSCLTCHAAPETAPAFLRTNARFNGGGGFGYVEGQPAGLISVTVPVPEAVAVLRQNLSAPVWAALGGVLLGLAGLVWSVAAGRRSAPAAASPAQPQARMAAPAPVPSPAAKQSHFPRTRFSDTQPDPDAQP